MRLACQAACRGDLEEVFKTEQYLLAARTPREVREGSQKLAARFIKTAGMLLNEEEKPLFARYGGEGNRHMVILLTACSARQRESRSGKR